MIVRSGHSCVYVCGCGTIRIFFKKKRAIAQNYSKARKNTYKQKNKLRKHKIGAFKTTQTKQNNSNDRRERERERERERAIETHCCVLGHIGHQHVLATHAGQLIVEQVAVLILGLQVVTGVRAFRTMPVTTQVDLMMEWDGMREKNR